MLELKSLFNNSTDEFSQTILMGASLNFISEMQKKTQNFQSLTTPQQTVNEILKHHQVAPEARF